MLRTISFALLLIAAPAWADGPVGPPAPPPPAVVKDADPVAPKLTLPPTVSTPANFPVTVKPSLNEGGLIRWAVADPGLQEYDLGQLLEPELAKKATSRMYWSAAPGRYRVLAVSAKGDLVSEIAVCTIIVGDAPPKPPTPPGPTPPTPPPTPASESPFKADGLRVLIVMHQADLAKYPATQIAALQSRTVQDYMSQNCVKGPDGVTPEWRYWYDDVDVSLEPQIWKDVFRSGRDKMPWIYVGNGKTGFSGPAPQTSREITELIGKYLPSKTTPLR